MISTHVVTLYKNTNFRFNILFGGDKKMRIPHCIESQQRKTIKLDYYYKSVSSAKFTVQIT